ncbi:hypothetical protein AB0I16_17455 [Streptomyces sp. NPDC050703]|uniref:hypothetical protein n=1 Tax=Streptomyces sp. NPDC050703 TaxID=3157218 RepID=UPI003422029C
MGNSGTTEVRRERARAERVTEGATVAVASALSFGLLGSTAVVFATTSWHLLTDSGTTGFSRFLAPLIFLALVALPLVLAHVVFRSGRRRGKERLTAAVPAALTSLGASIVPFAALCLILMYAN